ncbi:hypothetical protein BJY00DRAFT_310575 [Aspergillus carlsbadensis]|nr:hypothetical protein BJY00DRAFT_310575 [Aspergillus carlsbadensis]
MNTSIDDLISRFADFGHESGLAAGEQGPVRGTLLPSHPRLAANIDKDRLVVGFYQSPHACHANLACPAVYGAIGYPRDAPQTQQTSTAAPGPAPTPHPLVDLPLHEPNRPLPQIGETAAGYAVMGGWLYTAVGRVVGVTHHPKPVIWVQASKAEEEHLIAPYEAPQLQRGSSYLAWNWKSGPNALKPLPNVGEVADGLWNPPGGAVYAGRGRVVRVSEGRHVHIEPV